MLHNPAKDKMLDGQPAFGYALGLGSPLAAEALAHCGIDFLLLDTQHGSFGPDSTGTAALMAMADRLGDGPMARVARNDYTLIGRLLDEGALGIVVPMVNTAEDARAGGRRLPLAAGGNAFLGLGAGQPVWGGLSRRR